MSSDKVISLGTEWLEWPREAWGPKDRERVAQIEAEQARAQATLRAVTPRGSNAFTLPLAVTAQDPQRRAKRVDEILRGSGSGDAWR
jgi:hypothetical protein